MTPISSDRRNRHQHGHIHSGDKIKKLDPSYNIQGLVPVNLESGNFHPPFLTTVDDTVDAISGSLGKQRFEKAVSGMY